MAPLLNFGNSSKDRELADEMRAVLDQIRQERARFEKLVEGAKSSADRLHELNEPLAKAETDVQSVASRIEEMEKRFEAMVKLSQLFEQLDERAEGLTKSQQWAESRIVEALESSQQMRNALEDLSHKVDLAVGLRDQMVGFLEVEKPFQQIQSTADALRGQIDGTTDHVNKLREQHGRLLDAHKTAMSKMEALDRRREELSRDLTDKERRVLNVEQALRGMDGVTSSVADVKRDIGTLKALGDTVVQKTAALEAQGAAVDRALAAAEELDQAMRLIDAGIRQQQDNEKSLNGMQEQVKNLRALHEAVIQRSSEITKLQHETDEQARGVRANLVGMTDEMKKTVERFDFESRGLESVSERVADLRASLTDFENRYRGLSEQSQAVLELKAQTGSAAAQLTTLSDEIGQVEKEMTHLRAIRRDLDEAGRNAREIGSQVAQIQQAQPAVEAALRDVAQLSGANALVRDAIEQAKIAHAEIVRAREAQSDTQTWLGGVEHSVNELKDQVSELNQMAPVVDAALRQSQRVIETTSMIEARREFVDDLHRRLAEAGAIAGRLDERGQQLQTRMEAAEQRFATLGDQADDAEKLSQTMGAVAANVRDAEKKTGEIKKAVAAIAARCQSVDAIAEQTRTLRDEIEQRQNALAEAAKDLEQASTLRQEAANSAKKLEELTKRLTGALANANQRASTVEELVGQLEDRTTTLRAVETRLVEFDGRMAQWNLVEQEVARSLEAIIARQGTVEALRVDLDRMFAMAEKTAREVREITSSHREVEESRQLLQDVQGRLREIENTKSNLDDRMRQMKKAEERLARAEALLVDVHSSLEALQGQKVIVDQAVEKAGSLRGLLKQAEAVMEGLKEEREMTARVRAAVSVVRNEDDEDEQEDAKAA